MSYITTYTGKHFNPVEPQEELLDIRDIAHSLSLVCRANGHVSHFYSVGQHSVACAREAAQRGLSVRVCMGCLLHDASEAYLSDVTRPIKGEMTRYLEVEERLQELIWRHFVPGEAFSEEERRQIFAIDDEMLSWEFARLMPEGCGTGGGRISAPLSADFREMSLVEEDFLALYKALRSKLQV
ncbi:MAG: phosphohydrolase [Eubacteriales bacterium]|nr:phosphohydrolase [Eubacteriales bacterium]